MTIKLVRKPTTPAQPAESTPARSLKLLSVQDTAAYAKISPQTVHRLIRAGKLKTYRAGRQIRIDEADLVRYLAS